MKSHDFFLLVVRAIGLVVALGGLQNVIDSLMIWQGYANVNLSTPQYWAARGFIKIIAGVCLMVKSTPFVSLLYPLRSETAKDAPDHTNPAKESGRAVEPSVIFAVVVKTVGLIVFLYGLEYFVDSLMYSMTATETTNSDKSWVVRSVLEIAFGVALMRGLIPLADFAFPREARKTQPGVERSTTQNDPS